MPEVQKHGFSWEKELLTNVYGATEEELKSLSYTNKIDLPASLNRLDGADLSIKTSCSPNSVCMADCLRVYDAVSSSSEKHKQKPFHMTVVHYKQDDANTTKILTSITEVDLTNSVSLLFGSLVRKQIEELSTLIKTIPQKRAPTPEERASIYTLRNTLQPLSGALHLDIKCNSQQSRLQCSFNRFQDFIRANQSRCIAQSNTCEFRGKKIMDVIVSSRRILKAVV